MDKEKLNAVPEEEAAEIIPEAEEQEEETVGIDTQDEEIGQEASSEEERDDEISDEDDDDSDKDGDGRVLCAACGENEVQSDYEYCADCERAMLKRKCPFFAWIASAFLIVFSVVMAAFCVIEVAVAACVIQAESYAKAGDIKAAYEVYGTVLASIDEINAQLNADMQTNGVEYVVVRLEKALSEVASDYARSTVGEAEKYVEENNWHAAFEVYGAGAAAVNEINMYINDRLGTTDVVYAHSGIEEELVECVTNLYSPIDAYYYAVSTFGRTAEELEELPYMQKCTKIYNEHYDAYSTMTETLNAIYEEDAEVSAILEEFETYRGNEKVKDHYLDYYKFAAASQLLADMSLQLELLEDLKASCEATGEDYSWFYEPITAAALYEAGKYDEALVYVNKLVEKDRSDYEMYNLKMKIELIKGDKKAAGATVEEFKKYNAERETPYYVHMLEIEYLRCSGEYEKATTLCKEAKESYEQLTEYTPMIELIYMLESKVLTTSEIDRQQAMIYLAQGKYIDAFKSMMTAYSTESYYANYTGYSANLNDPKFYGMVYLTAKLLEDNEEISEDYAADVDQVLTMFGSADGMPDAVKSIINGETTVKKVLTEGVCDIV